MQLRNRVISRGFDNKGEKKKGKARMMKKKSDSYANVNACNGCGSTANPLRSKFRRNFAIICQDRGESGPFDGRFPRAAISCCRFRIFTWRVKVT